MVTVAQLVESQIVILVVVGSSPIGHPIFPTLIPSLSLLAPAGHLLSAKDPSYLSTVGGQWDIGLWPSFQRQVRVNRFFSHAPKE